MIEDTENNSTERKSFSVGRCDVLAHLQFILRALTPGPSVK